MTLQVFCYHSIPRSSFILSAHKLRYVLLNKDTKQVYFVVVITLLVKADVEQDEAHAIAEEKFKKDGEGAFQDDDDGVD